MKKINWPLALLFVWLFLFLFAVVISQFEPRFCTSSMLEALSKQQDVLLFNCPEFWLNRYQSLLGNMITAGVAGFTLYWLIRQLKAANRQAAVAAAQALRTIAAECVDEKQIILDRLARLQRFRQSLSNSYEKAQKTDNYYSIRTECINIITYTQRTKDKCEILITTHPNDQLGTICATALKQCDIVRIISEDLEARIRLLDPLVAIKSQIDDSWHRKTNEDAQRLGRAMSLLGQYLSGAAHAAGVRHHELWDQIREFEAAAITGH